MILDRILESRSLRTVISGVGVDQDAALSVFGPPRETTSGVDVTQDVSMTLSAVYAAVRLLSWTPAMLPLRVFEQMPNGDKELRADHPIDRLTQVEPNPEMTAMTFREKGQVQVLQWGRSVSFIERDVAGQPIGLWPMQRKEVELERLPNGEKTYDIRRVRGTDEWPHPPTTKSILFPFEVLDVPNLNGQSVIHNAREQMGEAVAAQQLGGGFFAGGSLYAFALKLAGKAGDPDKLRKNLAAVHGVRRRIPILEGGADLVQYGMALKDAQFLESRQFYITEVARWYGIPPHKLRDLIRATFSNIAEQKLEWHEDLLPWLIRWEQEMNRKLFAPQEQGRFFVEHVVEGLLRADSEARAKAYTMAIVGGWMNRNQVARKENLPQMGPIGDVYTVQGAMINLESLLKPPTEGNEADMNANENAIDDERWNFHHAAKTAFIDAIRTAVHREAAELRVLADEPAEFLTKLDKFYRRWPEKMAAIIRPTERFCRSTGVTDFDGAAIAAEHCRTAHEVILELSGKVNAAELRDRISAEVAEWEKAIPADLAATIFGGLNDGK